MVTTISDNIVTVKSPCDTSMQRLKVYFSPIQNGSGDPSPTNVRPITGWTGLDVTRRGKNLFNSDIENGGFNSSTGNEIANEKRLRSGFIFLKAGTYTISSSTTYIMVIVYIYDINKNYISDELINVFNYMPYTFTINGDRYIRLIWRRPDNAQIINDSIDNLQIELGSTATTYEPYSGTTIPVDWSSEAGSVYSGYVDLISGELVVDSFVYTFTGDENNWHDWHDGGANARWHMYTNEFTDISKFGPRTKVLCSHFMVTSSVSANWGYMRYGITNDNLSYISFNDANNAQFQSSEDFYAWLKGQYNNGTPVQVLFPLSTLVHYQLSPAQLNILRGINNIFSNANDKCEVTYDHRDTNEIINIRHNAVGSLPHQVTVSGSFVHFETDMAASLIISGTGNITIAGKNLIDDSKRYQQAAGYSLYIGATGTGYNIYLPAGTYRFTAEMYNNASYDLYYRKSDNEAKYIWHKGSKVTTAIFTLTESGLYRFNFTSPVKENVGPCCVSAEEDTGYEAYTGFTAAAGTARKSLVGINNIWSDDGSNLTVTYWTH